MIPYVYVKWTNASPFVGDSTVISNWRSQGNFLILRSPWTVSMIPRWELKWIELSSFWRQHLLTIILFILAQGRTGTSSILGAPKLQKSDAWRKTLVLPGLGLGLLKRWWLIFLMGNLLLGESIGNVFHFWGFLKQNRSWDLISKHTGRNGCTYEDQFGPTVCRCAHLDIQVSASSYRSFSSFPMGKYSLLFYLWVDWTWMTFPCISMMKFLQFLTTTIISLRFDPSQGSGSQGL